MAELQFGHAVVGMPRRSILTQDQSKMFSN